MAGSVSINDLFNHCFVGKVARRRCNQIDQRPEFYFVAAQPKDFRRNGLSSQHNARYIIDHVLTTVIVQPPVLSGSTCVNPVQDTGTRSVPFRVQRY